MRELTLTIVCVLALAGCSSEAAKVAKKWEPREGKICASNGTGDTLYFILSETGKGKMRSKITPNSRFCTSSFSSAQLSVSIEKRGTEYCARRAEQGAQYTLTKVNKAGECNWE